MLRKTLGYMMISAVALFATQAKADLYKECLDKNYMDDKEMAKCNDDEATRIMGEIRKKINSIAATSYFNNWDPSKKEFKSLLTNWETLRNQYCDLYGYTFTQGMGTISALQTSKCNVDMNKRFLDDLDHVVNIYQEYAN